MSKAREMAAEVAMKYEKGLGVPVGAFMIRQALEKMRKETIEECIGKARSCISVGHNLKNNHIKEITDAMEELDL